MAAAHPGVTPSQDRRFASVAVAVDIRERTRRIAGWVFFASLLIAPVLAALASAYVLLVAVAAGLLWAAALLAPRLRVLGPGHGEIGIGRGALEVTVDDPRRGRRTRWYPLAAITRGYRTDDEVRLQTRTGEMISVYIDGAAMGEAVLRAAGQDARQRVLEMPIASIASRVPAGTALAWLSIVFLGLPALFSIPLMTVFAFTSASLGESLVLLGFAMAEAVFLAGCFVVLLRRHAAIGADGIRFRRFFRQRFYPYGSIEAVNLVEGGVGLSLRSGNRVRLRTVGWWPQNGVDEAARALYDRIETARASAAPPYDVRAKLPLLERRGRAADAWRAHLGSLLGKAGYRTGALTAQDLGAVIDDASLPAEHRVAAAVALSATEPDEARARARIAASACADDDLRAALDRAAEGELDEARLDRLALRVRG